MRWFKSRRKYEEEQQSESLKRMESPKPEHVLTGIERMEQEARDEWQRKYNEERRQISARIAEIEKEIAPQLQELAMLRQKITPPYIQVPYLSLANMNQAIGFNPWGCSAQEAIVNSYRQAAGRGGLFGGIF